MINDLNLLTLDKVMQNDAKWIAFKRSKINDEDIPTPDISDLKINTPAQIKKFIEAFTNIRNYDPNNLYNQYILGSYNVDDRFKIQ